MAAQLFLGEFKDAVDLDLEDAAAAFDQLNIGAVFIFDQGLRTEGPWFVVSLNAVFDGDFHAPKAPLGFVHRHYMGRATGRRQSQLP